MRLFVAIPVEAPIKEKMLAVGAHLELAGARVRWCTFDQLHLTVKFIGEVADAKVAPICDAVRQATTDTPPFELTIAHTGCFPGRGAVRVIWIGAKDPGQQVQRLFDKVEDALAPLEIPRETRTFSLHFTIGRVKSDPSRGTLRQRILAAPFPACRQEVTELVVYQSTLTPDGARYAAVTRAPLGG